MNTYYILEPGTLAKPGDEQWNPYNWRQWDDTYPGRPCSKAYVYRRRAPANQCQWIPVGEREPVNEFCMVLLLDGTRPCTGQYWGGKWRILGEPHLSHRTVTHFCEPPLMPPVTPVDPRIQKIQSLLDNTKLTFPPGLAQALAGIT